MYSLSRKYSLFVFLSFFFMIFVMGYLFYKVFPKNEANFSFFNIKKIPDIYIVTSPSNNLYLLNIGVIKTYKDNLKKLQNKLKKASIISQVINIDKLENIPSDSVIFMPDTLYLNNKEFKKIKKFIKNGGNIIFNYHFGYMSEKGLVKAKRIEEITNLKYIKEGISKKNSPFLVPKVLSPFMLSSTKAHKMYTVLYPGDMVPVFKSSKIPDFLYSNWAVTSTLLDIDKKRLLDIKEDGALWHGKYKKGNWIYFNFPLYVLLGMNDNYFKFIFSNTLNYLKNPITVSLYPYLDYKKAIFVSEDTEYKYPYGLNFATLTNRYEINATLFCVAKLAQKYLDITKKFTEFNNIEIGSHSYSHKKIIGTPLSNYEKEIKGSKIILEKITHKKIYGFRPPREEIDNIMAKVLKESDYKYVMEKEKAYLLPKEEYKGIVTIPRHGTDDYLYLVELDWDKSKILKRIIYETNFLTSINALYTLSVHTHLLSYKSNIAVLKNYFEYLKTKKDIMPLKGIDLTKRYFIKQHLTIKTTFYADKSVITLNNQNKVALKNLKIRIYTPNVKITSIIPEIINLKIKIIKQTKEYTDVEISKINPLSTIAIIVKY